jgi:FG-GAP-like repeat
MPSRAALSGALVLIWLPCAALAQPRPATFGHPKQYPAGKTPVAAATADFNRDGKPDVAVADKGNGSVNILLNNGDGFTESASYPIVEANSIAVADINGDGIADLAVAGSVSVYVLIGNGDGTFQQPVDLGVQAKTLIAGDFNGDGRMDLALAAKQVLILLGNGDGTFGSPIASQTGDRAVVLSAGDFNNDGKLDIAAATAILEGCCDLNTGVVTLLGNGDGTFQPYRLVAGLGGTVLSVPPAILTADVNGDGRLDLLQAGTSDGVAVALGNGDGTFAPAAYYLGEADTNWISLADVDGDGYTDVVTANSCNSVSVFLGKGDGTFRLSASYATNSKPVWVGTANFLGHGLNDLAVLNNNGFLTVIPGMPGGKFRSQRAVDLPQSLANPPVLADFNGDGKLDAAVMAAPSIAILLGDGNGNFHAGRPVAAGPSPLVVTPGDFNGDGKADLAVTDQVTNLVYILLGNGDGTFFAGPAYPVPPYSWGIATADLNSDGNVDLVIQGSLPGAPTQYITQVFLGNGDGTFGGAMTVTSSAGLGGPLIGDYNGDGIPDLVLSGGPTGSGSPIYPQLFLGNGDGTFRNPTTIYQGAQSWPSGAGDFNGDGKLDLAISTEFDDLVVLLGNGNGTFQVGQTISQAGGSIVSDINCDGHLDLVNAWQHFFVLYLGNGDGTFVHQPGEIPRIGYDSTPAAGDLNGDGKPDLVSAQSVNDYGTGWRNPVSAVINTTATQP